MLLFVKSVKLRAALSFQITVYLGKRDFIDHLTHIDPIGELTIVRDHILIKEVASILNYHRVFCADNCQILVHAID